MIGYMTKPRYLLMGVAFLLMLHAAYSTVQYRKYLKLTERPFERVPNDIILEAIVSVIVSAIAIALFPTANYRPINITTHIGTTTYEQREANYEFRVFSHRGAQFLPKTE